MPKAYRLFEDQHDRDQAADEILLAIDEFAFVHSVTEHTPEVLAREHPRDGVNPQTSRQLHAAMGMANEAGEILQLYKKDMFHYGRGPHLTRERVVDEMGDLFWYFWLMLLAWNISFVEILLYNAKKLRERHKEKFDAATSVSREDGRDGISEYP